MRALVAVTVLSLSRAVAHGLLGEMNGKRGNEQEHLKRTDDQVRKEPGESGKVPDSAGLRRAERAIAPRQAFSRSACQRKWSPMKVEMK